jgi:two-component sensor histidine kinase
LLFAVGCFVLATGIHSAFRLIRPDLAAYSTYYAAVFFATIVGGVASGLVALVLGGLAAWFIFEPSFLTVRLPTSDMVTSLLLYVASSACIIWGAEGYRLVVRRLDEEKHYHRLVVNELNHRIKNKFATVHAVLGHELHAHREVWGKIAGRLRALAAADELLVNSDGQSAAIADILTAELSAYDASRITVVGESIRLPSKLVAMLALVFHELATNAAKYGALSHSSGCVRVSWHADGSLTRINWAETGGPEVLPPKRSGFGTKLLRHALDPFHGTVATTYDPTGLRCDITFELPRDSEALHQAASAGGEPRRMSPQRLA